MMEHSRASGAWLGLALAAMHSRMVWESSRQMIPHAASPLKSCPPSEIQMCNDCLDFAPNEPTCHQIRTVWDAQEFCYCSTSSTSQKSIASSHAYIILSTSRSQVSAGCAPILQMERPVWPEARTACWRLRRWDGCFGVRPLSSLFICGIWYLSNWEYSFSPEAAAHPRRPALPPQK